MDQFLLYGEREREKKRNEKNALPKKQIFSLKK